MKIIITNIESSIYTNFKARDISSDLLDLESTSKRQKNDENSYIDKQVEQNDYNNKVFENDKDDSFEE